MNDMIDGRTAESCAAYNMIKMARTLFSLEPDARYADFVERADLNAILGGQDPEDGRVSSMVPVGRGVQHEYQDKFEDFTCCVGSQMETHAFHAYGIYNESGNKLWVSQYAPTTVDWTSQGIKLEMVTDLPMGDSATLKITSGNSKSFTHAQRRPYWAGSGFTVKVSSPSPAEERLQPRLLHRDRPQMESRRHRRAHAAQDAPQRVLARQSKPHGHPVGTARARRRPRPRAAPPAL